MGKWETVRLVDVCDFQGGAQPPKEEWLDHPQSGYIRMLQIRDFTQERKGKEDFIRISSRNKTCDVDDILIARYGASLGKILCGLSGAYNVAIMKTIPDQSIISKKFLYEFLISDKFQKYILSVSSRAAQAGFNKDDLKSLQLPIPPLDVQKKIADLLDKDSALIELRKAQLDKLDLLIKSQFVEMFGDPVTNTRSWPLERLGNLGELNRGVSKYRPRNDPSLLNGPYPLIQTGEVTKSSLYITDYNSTYSEIGLAQSRMWPAGTLCITIAANIAQTAILSFNACFPDSVVGFIPREKTNPIYLHFWFEFFQKTLEEQAPQVAQKNINLQILNNLDVTVPPLSLQNEFAAFVQQVETQKKLLQNSLEKMELNYKSLMQKCFRGEIF